MGSIYPLVQNETIKMLKKRRFLVVLLILAILIPMFTYAQMKVAQNYRKQFGTQDWRVTTQQQIIDYTNRLGSNRVPEEIKKYIRVEVKRLQYALEKNVDPQSPNGVTFARDFMKNAVGLFVPLLIAVIGSDIVSSEHSTGTIKLLLTRPVSRWKVLLSKLLTLLMFVALILLATGILSYLIAGLVFGYAGWTAPVLTGYQIAGDELSTANVHAVPQWLYLIMEFGLAWFSCAVVACLSLMVSVLVRSTAASMGIMLATLIAGTILSNMVSSWQSAKYFFMVNLETVNFLTGQMPPIPGVTLSFSLAVLAAWAVCGLIVAFVVFERKDILN
ncbi:ABC transporter permease [Paenibacillus sp. J31TS4]|uniref:ABC transporter permease n=1 Tax=Paenibacillus sp. J31TS4 TaxID=2807195 RepID=UPI001B0AB4D9|nr:ABC transporter permease [Paenibacillus sp. J31TS4]GIP37397.1 ABC transporter permease [Paenibacillus sp. J31TS4]